MACELPVPVSARAVREACTALHDMPIGAYERVGLSCGTCCQLKRAMRYHFCEGPNLCRACAASVAGAAVYVVVGAAVCTGRKTERCWHVHVSWNIPYQGSVAEGTGVLCSGMHDYYGMLPRLLPEHMLLLPCRC